MTYKYTYNEKITITIEVDETPNEKMPFSYRLTEGHKNKRVKDIALFNEWVQERMIETRDIHAEMLNSNT